MQAVREEQALAGGDWADLGTGSGALAAGLARSSIISPQQVSKWFPIPAHRARVDNASDFITYRTARP